MPRYTLPLSSEFQPSSGSDILGAVLVEEEVFDDDCDRAKQDMRNAQRYICLRAEESALQAKIAQIENERPKDRMRRAGQQQTSRPRVRAPSDRRSRNELRLHSLRSRLKQIQSLLATVSAPSPGATSQPDATSS